MLNATFSVISKHCGQILSFLKVVFTLFLSFIQILRFISSIVLHAALERIYTLSQQNEYLFRCPKLEAIVFSKFEERREKKIISQKREFDEKNSTFFQKFYNVKKIVIFNFTRKIGKLSWDLSKNSSYSISREKLENRPIQFTRKIGKLRFVEKIVIFNFTRKIVKIKICLKNRYSIHEKNRQIKNLP